MRRIHGIALFSATAALLALCVGGLAGYRLGAEPEAEPGLYIADPLDCICGLSDPRQLTNPAQVDFPVLLEATPQYQEMRRKGIDPDSARGVILRTRAEALVQVTCGRVQRTFKHCSIWKAIRRRDGRPITDRTADVRTILEAHPVARVE